MAIGELLADKWGLTVERVDVLDGGMNSRTWLVYADSARVVVKSVELNHTGFGPGLELAARLDAAGLTTGAPVRSIAGNYVEKADDRQVAVLQYVDGVPLTSSAEDAAIIGTTLARVHEIARCEPGDLEQWLTIVTQLDEYLDHEPWIRPAVTSALDEVRGLAGSLTWSGLHGDPAPEAFLRQLDGEVALIDWGSAMTGPALYDLASAVMYVGEHVVPAYGVTAEVEAGLATFLRMRYAVQAAYFAWRSSTDDLTGIADPAENAKGLADARRAFGVD